MDKKKFKQCQYCNTSNPPWRNKYCSDECSYKAKARLSGTKWTKLRFEILTRDGFKCVYCGRNPVQHNIVLHVDHYIPATKGGTNDTDNLFTSCEDCNLGKNDVLLPEEIKPRI